MFFLHLTNFYTSHLLNYLASDLLCHIFLQCGIEEAQFVLLNRDEVIHQVGTEIAVQGSDQIVRNSSLKK